MNKYSFALIGISAVLFSGCSEKSDNRGPMQIRIAPTIETRVTGMSFDSGDCIGLSIVRNMENYADNVMMTYSGSVFTASGLLWYSGTDDKSELTAYYPYSKSGRPNEFTIQTDQQTNGCSTSDLMIAKKTDVKPSAVAVGMTFRHLLSQLSIAISNSTQSTIVGVTIDGSITTAMVDFTASKAVAKSGVAPEKIKAHKVSASLYQAVLVPQEAALTVTVFTEDGDSRSKTISDAILDGGKKYSVTVDVSATDMKVSISGDILDWADGGSLDDGGSSKPGGDEDKLIYQGVTYKTVEINGVRWMAENMRYIPDNSLLGKGVWYPSKGGEASEDPAYVRERGMLYSHAVAVGGDTSVPVRGICPSGWHIPSKTELMQLSGAEAGFFISAGFWNSNLEIYGADTRGYFLSSDLTDDKSMVYCLNINNNTVMTLMSGYGLSLRCVKDTQK